ncbi:MAG: molybdopterin-dependent oxidoreductase, partial [Eggerthellaceae bacterium]|nr:molybdopterin-dependent oxidoreductase [Eggerthellaceae bacterium]
LADVMSKKYKTGIISGWAPARTQNSDNLPQMVMTLGAMGGHFGKSGHMTGVCCHSSAFTSRQSIVGTVGSTGIKIAPRPPASATIADICKAEVWKAVAQGQYTYSQSITDEKTGQKMPVNIKMIVNDSAANTQTCEGQPFMVQVHRGAEFVVAHGQFETTNCRYADIILPITSKWEEDGGGSLHDSVETVAPYGKVVEPKYETKSEIDVEWEYAKYRGVDVSAQGLVTDEQGWFNLVKGATYRDVSSGTNKPLIKITADDLVKMKVNGKDYAMEGGRAYTQNGLITYDQFMERGAIAPYKRHDGDRYVYIANKAFAEGTAEKATESGKLEIYCARLRDRFNKLGYSVVSAIPTYIPPYEGYEETFEDYGRGIKGKFPFQFYNPHYWRRSHTVFDNVLWMREAWPNPFFVNAQDAEAKGVKNGDPILLTSPHGRSIRHACVTNRMMPGVVGVPHGAWLDLDESLGIDLAGSDNWIAGAVATGQGTSGYNTGICNWEKYNGELVEDCMRPQRLHQFE